MAEMHNSPFEDHCLELASLAKALGHPARIRILEILAQTPGCYCGDIVDELPLAQATVSQHLRELRRAGLITGTTSGPRSCFCLDSATLQAARAAFTSLFSGIGCCPAEGEPHEFNEPNE